MRCIALAALLALSACSALPTNSLDERTPGGITVYANEFSYSAAEVDRAWQDVEACVKLDGTAPEVHLHARPIFSDRPDVTGVAYPGRVIVEPDLGSLRHEMAHALLHERTGSGGREDYAREVPGNCFGVHL